MNKRNIENNLKVYGKILEEIKEHSLSDYEEAQLKTLSRQLRARALDGEPEQQLLPEVFAVVFEVVKRVLGITPFDVQLLAAAAMASGRIAELPTGEGKTLCAVFVACLGALSGKGVHVLTFNDYLAKRDAVWMKPVFDFWGLSVQSIHEGMDKSERKKAYQADITYLTAKEAGFDYLRSFLAGDMDSIVQRPYHMAIVDEADSILIDEARIPLVIAGDMPARVEMKKRILSSVSKLQKNTHFTTEEYSNSLSLTERGVTFLEDQLDVDNLYDPKNLELLSKINVSMQAVFLLKKDIGYIVRGEQVLLVDEFTGRISKNRQWSDGLQDAVELKEGLAPQTHGIVMNRITLQNFLQFYPFLCGMTGTACPSASEFYEFYEKTVTVIPPHKPCIRIDHPDLIFTHKDAKHQALVKEIEKVHALGRPVLVGTATVEESEYLAKLLRPYLPGITVLNARNDAEEAGIIANAGKRGAVTISTNMAGRGVDIRLGGGDTMEYQEVCALGGLYVIGTNRYESLRIDQQLRGRAGRQGDPGESRFFISLEDDLLEKYGVTESIPPKYRDRKQIEPLKISAVNKAVLHVQRVVEGQALSAKITLSKYSSVAEDQRKIVHQKRMKILAGEETLSVLEKENPAKLKEILKQVSISEYQNAQRQVELFAVNQCWADHLLALESAMDEVQVISQVRGDPFLIYNQKLVENFDHLQQHVSELILNLFDRIVIHNGHIDLDKMGIRGPSSTRTYLIDDGSEQLGMLNGIAASLINAPLFGLYLFTAFWDKLRKKSNES
ncbi:MAG TPA: accessory Sec system translocase SecA2 [Clostridia bacterium]|nr:accessory Sec system translocase SecA2 [Clostridia bacterium]